MTGESLPEEPSRLSDDELSRVPPDVREKLQGVLLYREGRLEAFSSPLLPPEILQRYDNVIPGLAEKLVAWTEEETRHRRVMEKGSFDEFARLRVRAQIFGFVTSIGGLLGAVTLGGFSAVYQSTPGAAAAVLIALVGVGGPFVARILAERVGARNNDDGQ